MVLRAIAAADRARFLHAHSKTCDELPRRRQTTPEIEALVGAQLDQLSSVSTTHDERIVLLAQMKALLAPELGAATVQVLHDLT